MTTANMGLTEPTDHGSNATWGSILNGTLDLIDAHDHTTGKGVKVPSAGLNINADVSWSSSGTNYAITDVRALDFTQVTAASVSALADALFVSSADSNLYFRNHTGTNVQITSGTALNVSIVGGIGGDYSSISALVDYDDASDTYRFRQQVSAAVRQFAKMSSGDLNLFEYKAAGNATVPTNSVTLKSPSALAGAYSLTMPAALPGSTVALTISSSGVIATDNTAAKPLLFTTADTIVIPALMAQCPGGTATRYNPGDSWSLGTSTDVVEYPICLPVGYQINSWSLAAYKGTNNTKTITAQLYDITGTGTSEADTGLGSSQTNSGNATGDVALAQSGLTQAVASGHRYIVRAFGSGTAGDYFGALTITAKRVS